jgi:two-component system, NtrC family, response regulator AtoC
VPDASTIFGSSPRMQAIHSSLPSVAASDVPVLVHGESGTGKELVARQIHKLSRVSSGRFVTVNCPAIPPTLFESELFGYQKGAFTGANGNKLGRVALADRGTLFLDEIGELDSGLQAKLLQLLQDGNFCPIGGDEDKAVNTRVICATNLNLEEEIAKGTFRQDLFYRINVVNLHLVPLRERTVDIPALVSYFIETFNDEFNCRAKPPSCELMKALQTYHWPGNLRQLENLMKRYVILGNEGAISSELEDRKASPHRFAHVPDIPAGGSISLKAATKEMVRDFEQQIIAKALEAHSWNGVQTARALKISYRAFLYKVKEVRVATSKSTVNMSDESVGL